MGGAPGRYWHRLDDGRLQCDVCPRLQAARGAARPVLRARPPRTTQIVLTTYGRSSGFCIDPIEKKPLNHFLPGTPVLSFGTAGCNLACKFCQNWDISQVARDRHAWPTRPRRRRSPRPRAAHGCRSVAFTYNDPVIFPEYAIDVAAGLPRARRQDRGRDGRLHLRRAARASSTATWTPPTSTSRGSPTSSIATSVPGQLAAGARHARVPQARDQRLARDHHAAHSRARTIRDGELARR